MTLLTISIWNSFNIFDLSKRMFISKYAFNSKITLSISWLIITNFKYQNKSKYFSKHERIKTSEHLKDKNSKLNIQSNKRKLFATFQTKETIFKPSLNHYGCKMKPSKNRPRTNSILSSCQTDLIIIIHCKITIVNTGTKIQFNLHESRV